MEAGMITKDGFCLHRILCLRVYTIRHRDGLPISIPALASIQPQAQDVFTLSKSWLLYSEVQKGKHSIVSFQNQPEQFLQKH
jgi:hypothetical protein